jgi:hypothetical protein
MTKANQNSNIYGPREAMEYDVVVGGGPLAKARMGDNCKSYTVDKGTGGMPGTPATYVGMCHIFCDCVEFFQAGLAHTQRKSWTTSRTTPIWPR